MSDLSEFDPKYDNDCGHFGCIEESLQTALRAGMVPVEPDRIVTVKDDGWYAPPMSDLPAGAYALVRLGAPYAAERTADE